MLRLLPRRPTRRPTRRTPALVVVSAVLLPALSTLTACSSVLGRSDLDEALDLVPADATRVVFRDREAIVGRLGVDDVGRDADEDERRRYAEALAGDVTDGDVLTDGVAGGGDAALDELGVVWSVEATTEAGTYTAYRVDGDVDLDAVADDLVEAGYAEDDLAGRRHLTGAGVVDGPYPPSWIEVTLDPDEDLLVVGPAGAALDLLDDEASSVYDDDTFEDLLDDTDDVQYAVVAAPPACAATLTPQQVADSGASALGSPEATAYLVTGDDGTPSARLRLADDDAAEADLEARRTYLADGSLGTTGRPVASLGGFDLEREDAVVRVGLDLDDPVGALDAVQRQDGFLACTPAPAKPTEPTEPTEPGASVSPTPTPDPGVTGPTDDATVDLP